MRDEILTALVKKFMREALVFCNFLMNRVLAEHPETADSDEIREMRVKMREIKELEEHL